MHEFEQLPADIDLNTADERTLRRYGLPRRPDPEKQPHLARAWRRVVARLPHPRLIKPDLEPDTLRKRRLPKTEFGVNAQAGAVVPVEFLGPTEVANVIYGEWTIPQVFPIAGNPTDIAVVSFWVGLSGMESSGAVSLLQAGVAAVVGVDINNPIYWPWIEWYTSNYQTPSSKVTNFAISPGDQISVLVCAPQSTMGVALFVNYATGQAMTVPIPQPAPGVTAQGSTAQWTVEQQAGAPLPQFTAVEFTNCSGGTPDLSFDLSAPAAGAENIVDSNNNILAVGSILSATSASVVWKASM